MIKENVFDFVDQELMLKDYWSSLCKVHNIEDNRVRRNVRYKHAFMVACREYSNLSLSTIGGILGKDHATVLHAVKIHSPNYLYDQSYRDIYDVVSEDVSSKIMEYSDGVEKMMEKRIDRIDASVFNEAVIQAYKKKLKKQKENYEERIANLTKENSVLKRNLKTGKEREKYLNEECLRLKNLL